MPRRYPAEVRRQVIELARSGTDLARHSAEDLAAVAATLNSRPRKTLGWRTPAEVLDEHLATAR